MDARPTRLTPEELLTHTSWVRTLARSLVRDEATAEDLAQGTYLAALRHPPRTDRPIRPWLRGVLRNFLRQRHREERRRSRRERGAARPEADLPTPEDLAARLEMQRRVSRVVAGLREPLRSTVLLRYAEDLSSAEIGRRKGIPAGTVRWRLKTALDEIRARLDEEHDGDRRCWVLGLLPLIGSLERDAGATSTTAASAAALKAFLAVAVGTVLLVVMFGPTGFLGTAVPVDRPPDKEQGEFADAAGVPGAEGAASEAARSNRRGKRAIARMRFLDGAGRPIPGVEIRYRMENSPVVRARSGADGILEFAGDHSAPDRFKVVAPGRATRFFEVKLTRGAVTDLGDFVLDPGCVLTGRITDRGGTPVPKARVLLTEGELPEARLRLGPTEGPIGRFDFAAYCDSQGNYRFADLPASSYRVWARARDHLWSVSASVKTMVESAAEVDLRLKSEADADAIEGRILDPTGAPAAGVEIHYSVSAPGFGSYRTTMTARDGRFRILLPFPMRLDLRIRDPKERWTGLDLDDLAANAPPLELKLGEARFLRLVVTDTEGAALENLVHTMEYPDSTVPNEPERKDLHPDGVLVLRQPPRKFAVRVRSPFHESKLVGPFEPNAAPLRHAVQLASRPGIRGRVVWNGRPVAGARIHVVKSLRKGQVIRRAGFRVRFMEVHSSRTRTNARGSFHADLRIAGEIRLLIRADGFAPKELGPFPFDPEQGLADLEVTLGPGGAIEGRLLLPPGESPAGAIIGISRADTFPRSQRVGPDGKYRFDLLTPGPYVVRRLMKDIRPGGGGTSGGRMEDPPPIPFTCVVEEGETTIHDLDERAGPVCELLGSLRIDGVPSESWTVVLVDDDPRRDPTLGHPETATGPDGSFRLALPQTGHRRLTLSRGDGQVGLSNRVLLERGVNTWRCEFETGTISGRIASSLGRGEILAHRRQVGDGVYCMTRIFPDAEGRFSRVLVPAGKGELLRTQRGLFDVGAAGIAEVLVPLGGDERVSLP